MFDEIGQIYNEDCFTGMKKLPPCSIDLIVTAPPYKISEVTSGGSVNDKLKLNQSLRHIQSKGNSDGYDIFKLSREVSRLQGENINAYFWCSKSQIYDYLNAYVGVLGCKYDIITWHKTDAVPTYSNKYLSDTEYCLYFHKGKGQTHPKNYQSAKTYYVEPSNQKEKKAFGYPFVSPLSIIKTLIANSSQVGDVVLDPFMGSGTTALACIDLHRGYIGYEKEKQWCDLAEKRIRMAKAQLSLF